MSCFRKCFSHITVFSLTRKPSRRSWRFIKLHQRALAGFLVGNLKKCNPDLLPSLLYSKLLHSAAAHSFPRLRCFLLFRFPSCFLFFSVLFLLHFEEKKAKSESVYRVSLDPVQNLCLLDENPAVSQKERGIRNWTIENCSMLGLKKKLFIHFQFF